MQSLKTVLSRINLDDQDKFLSREFQKYGIYLAERLGDMVHKPLYIKMAKEIDRKILDQALSFVLDANARSKARLFMWKVTQIKAIKQ
ncbi:MAG: hypothetical protein M1484_02110 [Patescibacteria group bacterium]|nr:hypothetical protein [Patescibacteria group bacterium]MCL5431875.1 hypothetical protein [Patescibacteria group bacterium]